MYKGIAFKRISTSKQDNASQTKEINQFVKGFNVEIVKEFEEQISGATKFKDRPVLQEAIKYVEDNNIKFVGIAELSRLGRTNEVIQLIKDWGEQGVSVLMSKERRGTLDATGRIEPTMLFTLNVLAAINEYELTTIEQRVRRGVKHWIFRCILTPVPEIVTPLKVSVL
jgi:DNA invertase Pin-like site-specific DNA recombinase